MEQVYVVISTIAKDEENGTEMEVKVFSNEDAAIRYQESKIKNAISVVMQGTAVCDDFVEEE